MKISLKLILISATMLILLTIMGITAIVGIGKVNGAAGSIKFSADYDESIMSTIITVVKQQDAITDYSLTLDDKILAEIIDFNRQFSVKLSELKSIALSEKEHQIIEKLADVHDHFYSVGMNMADAFKSGDREKGLSLMHDFDRAVTNQEAVMEEIENIAMAIATKSMKQAEDTASGVKYAVWVLLIVTLAIGATGAFYLVQSISGPLEKLTSSMNELSQGKGDLTKQLDVNGKDEIAEISSAFNAFMEQLQVIISEVKSGSEQVSSVSLQISAASQEIAADTQRQDEKAGLMAVAVEELSATIIQIAGNSNEASSSAAKAVEALQRSSDIVQQTIVGMSRLSTSVSESSKTIETLGTNSEQIGEIIEVIDEIADQTNLLALNAAIEAARAGEQGKGFAVVADEVRKLAERTTKATKEIAVMIRKIQEDTEGAVDSMRTGTMQVEEGVTLAHKAGTSVKESTDAISLVTNMITQIAAASAQQSIAAQEISVNVESVSSITKTTAVNAEQSSASMQGLTSKAIKLQELVGSFKLQSERPS